MRRRIPVLIVLCLAALAAAWLIAGCGSSYHGRYAAPPAARMVHRDVYSPAPRSSGGSANVNAAAHDAMYFKDYGVNPAVDADEDPVSTFAVDVDTGSYTLCRSYLERGSLPPEEAVRVEEFVNYFDYDYSPPRESSEAFAVHLDAAPSPFRRGRTLLRVGLKAREVSASRRRPAALVLVIDTSGSMNMENRLGLVKQSLRLLVDKLGEGDTVGIVEYGTTAREVLAPTAVRRRERILAAVDGLRASGSTNAEDGLRLGYRMASRAAGGEDDCASGGTVRVILLSDGVANVGRTGPDEILETIRKYVEQGITLSTVGVGMGNYNDILLERLADQGNGHYTYVDTLDEARRVFVDELSGTLELAARDAKIQVDFNRRVVRSYRLLGYENRELSDREFRSDRADGGEVGAGHAVTALYELRLWDECEGRLATVRVRHKTPAADDVIEVSRQIATEDASETFASAPRSLRLAASVAEFAEVLRGSRWARSSNLDDVIAEARRCDRGWDRSEDVKELVTLMEKARRLGAGADGKDLARGEDEDDDR
jgi:Ca-activated chloride channel family protein